MTVNTMNQQQRLDFEADIERLLAAANRYLGKSNDDNSTAVKDDLLVNAYRLIQTIRGPSDMALTHVENIANISSIRALLQAGVFHAIPTGGERISAKELSSKIGIDKTILARLMRAATVAGIGPFIETGEEEYAHTPFSEAYLESNVADVLPVMADFVYVPMLRTAEFLREESWQNSITTRYNPFTLVHNCPGRTMFEYMYANPVSVSLMTKAETAQPETIQMDSYPWAMELEHLSTDNGVTIVDIGGSRGGAIKEIKKLNPRLRGKFVLEDLEPVIQENREALKSAGIEPIVYDFLNQPQPVKGALVYYFRRIFHDWPDAPDCEKILQHTAKSMDPVRSRLLIHDMIVPEAGANMKHAWADLSLMAIGGVERTEKGFAALLDRAGFELVKVWKNKGDSLGIVEARLKAI